MKKISLLLLFVALLSSCVNSPSNKKVSIEPPKKDIIKVEPSFKLATIIENEMKGLNISNEMMRDKMAKKLQKKVFSEISKDGSIISQVPVIYSDAMEKGNKYIVKFEYPMTLSRTVKDISSKYQIVFSIFSVVGSDIMGKLKDNCFYHISGKFCGDVSGKIVLPSGDTFYNNPSITTDDYISNKVSIDLGGMYYKQLKIQ
jgi:hypothetical protein